MAVLEENYVAERHVESFPLTSTPKKQEFKCEDCSDTQQCDTCFVPLF